MLNLIEDVSKLSNIQQSVLLKLCDISKYCICDSLLESKLKGESITYIDIGIGKLNILVDEESIEYQFIPAKSFEKNIKKVILDNYNPLVKNAEDTLNNKIKNTYKELL